VVKGPIYPLPDCISEAEKAISLSVIEKHKQYCEYHSIMLRMYRLDLTYLVQVSPLFSFLNAT